MKQATVKMLATEQIEKDLQFQFSRFDNAGKARIANYLNAYNLTAYLYNELLSEDERKYVDTSMQYVIETQKLSSQMENVQTPGDVDQVVSSLNDGE